MNKLYASNQPGKKDAWMAAIHKDKLTWTQLSDLKFGMKPLSSTSSGASRPPCFSTGKERSLPKTSEEPELDQKLEEVPGH